MNPQAFQTLEFDSLRALVRRGAQTAMGQGRIDALAPSADLRQLQRALTVVGENIELRQGGSRFSFDGIADTTDSLSRLQIEGAALEPLALLDLARLCERAIEARAAILAEREQAPTLFEIVADVPVELKKLSALLTRKILPGGELDDRASPELARIRRELATARSRITRSLEGVMRRSSEAIQEQLVTVRNDRFVIPVRADHRGRINGVAHGSSSSGQTIFIEPLETIEANNELQSLREAEQREIAEILFALSAELRRELPAIERASEAIAELDFINAKAAFADRFDCVVPEVAGSADILSALSAAGASNDSSGDPNGKDRLLEFVEARHPLLEETLRATGATVVPVSFKLDANHTTMVISGANAGGKTVVLKTAGLLSLMALSGLPVPAKLARVPFYRSVLADIGDHERFCAACCRNRPETRHVHSPHEVEKLSIRRLESLGCLAGGHPNRAASFRRHLPNLPDPRPIRSKVDPAPVARPAWLFFLGRLPCEARRLRSVGVDDVDVAVAAHLRRKDQALSVGRPLRRCDHRSILERHLLLIGSVGAGDPDLVRARAIRCKCDTSPVGRNRWEVLKPCRARNPPDRVRTTVDCIPAPDVHVARAPLIHEARRAACGWA